MSQYDQLKKWKISSSSKEGFHQVIKPGVQDCKAVHIFRLNLSKGKEYVLESKELEMDLALIKGAAKISSVDLNGELKPLDSFYIPGGYKITIIALENLVCYIGGAICEGLGKPFIRHFDKNAPLGGGVREVHGKGAGSREVHFTISHNEPGSRLICGLTWSGDGTWTSWPPHQHENDLEEVYCYFDMDAPKLGLHISYLAEGDQESFVAHPVQTGDMVIAPRGYHPTVATPGTKNAYFWVLAAFTPKSRRYDLAILDPTYKDSQAGQ